MTRILWPCIWVALTTATFFTMGASTGFVTVFSGMLGLCIGVILERELKRDQKGATDGR